MENYRFFNLRDCEMYDATKVYKRKKVVTDLLQKEYPLDEVILMKGSSYKESKPKLSSSLLAEIYEKDFVNVFKIPRKPNGDINENYLKDLAICPLDRNIFTVIIKNDEFCITDENNTKLKDLMDEDYFVGVIGNIYEDTLSLVQYDPWRDE